MKNEKQVRMTNTTKNLIQKKNRLVKNGNFRHQIQFAIHLNESPILQIQQRTRGAKRGLKCKKKPLWVVSGTVGVGGGRQAGWGPPRLLPRAPACPFPLPALPLLTGEPRERLGPLLLDTTLQGNTLYENAGKGRPQYIHKYRRIIDDFF